MIRKGIILAGGSGTRLHPMTAVVTKQLLPIYNKPLIFYPLSTLMTAGIREVLIISQTSNIPLFQKLFGDGSDLGMSISYAVQDQPNGIAEAFIVGESFIKDEGVALMLGDNIFYGHGLQQSLHEAAKKSDGATIFGYRVHDPERYGVAVLDEANSIVAIEEKPQNPKSNIAITGIYFYDNSVVKRAKSLTPSLRGELEITDLNNTYIADYQLHAVLLDTGIAWLDTGTPESLLQASQFVEVIEKRQGLKIACLEEIAYRNGWISKETIVALAEKIKNSDYGTYLRQFIQSNLI